MLKRATKRIKTANSFSKFAMSLVVVIVAGAGTYALVNSRAATVNLCPNVAAGACRPFDDLSAWNTPIPNYQTAVADPSSTTWINGLKALNKPLSSNPDIYTIPVYSATSSTPRVRVQLLGGYQNAYDKGDYTRVGGFEALIQNVPLDKTKVKIVPDDSDSQVSIWDPNTGDLWEFWQFRPAQHTDPNGVDPNTGESNYTADTSIEWVATNFTKYHTKTDAQGNRYYGRLAGGGGGRGAGTPYMAGLVRPWEISQGSIEHALAFAFGNPCCGSKSGMPATSQTFRYPATKSDGASSNTNNAPEGTRMQLDPNLTDAQLSAPPYNLNQAGLIIAHALQKYGMYVIDNSGSSKIYVESNITANNGLGWGSALTTNTLNGIPWDSFRFVSAPCDPTTAGCSPIPTNSTTGGSTPQPPTSKTYYVSQAGQDTNVGSQSAPFKTIQKAANVAIAGDTVVVDDGIYPGTITVPNSGTATSYITFKSKNKWGAIIDGQSNQYSKGFVLNGKYIRIEGFEIRNFGNATKDAAAVEVYNGGDYSIIIGNNIHDIGKQCASTTNTNGLVGVYIQGDGVTVEQNYFHDIGRFRDGENGCTNPATYTGWQVHDHGVYMSGGSTNIVRNNVFKNFARGWAVQMYPGPISGARVVNNTFVDGNPFRSNSFITTYRTSISGSSIANNIFFNNGSTNSRAIDVGGSTFTNTTIANNLSNGAGLYFNSDTGSTSAPASVTDSGNKLNALSSSIFANSLSSTPDGFKLLASSSPAYNSGANMDDVREDYAGVSRPQNTLFDIGAYEYTGTTTTPPDPVPPADLTPPTTTISSKPSNPTTNTSASFTFSANETSTFKCSLDNSVLAPCTDPAKYSSLAIGSHTFKVQATDAAGNVEANPPSYTWTVSPPADTTAPTLSLAPANGATGLSGTVTITATASDASGIHHVDIYVDNNLVAQDTSAPYTTSWVTNTPTVANGSHTIKAIAYDNAATPNSTTVTNSVSVNNTDQTIPTPPQALRATATGPTSVYLSWGASSDNIAVTGYRVLRNGEVKATINSTVYTDTTAAASTTYNYTVIAIDAANNPSNPSNTATVTTPAPPDTTPPPAPANLNAAIDPNNPNQVNLTWSSVTDSSGIKGYNVYRGTTKLTSSPVNTTSFGDGTVSASTSYTYTVKAVDGANLESSASNIASITTPTPPPPATITTLSFTPTDDTFVNSRRSNNNYGKNTTLVSIVSPTKYSLYKFNVTGIGTKTVKSAKMRLYVNNGSSYGGAFHKISTNTWTESTTTWNNKPSWYGNNLSVLGKVSSGTWVEADLSSLVTSDGTYGILINSSSSNTVGYSSKETNAKPQLILGVQ